MMTIVTHVHLKEGAGREWDGAMRTRLSAAKKRRGWVGIGPRATDHMITLVPLSPCPSYEDMKARD
jgi:hypothetical protein